MLPITAEDFAFVFGTDALEGEGADVGADAADAAVGEGTGHDAGMQSLHSAVVAAERNGVALNASDVDYSAVPVLAEVRIAARAGATADVGHVAEHDVKH